MSCALNLALPGKPLKAFTGALNLELQNSLSPGVPWDWELCCALNLALPGKPLKALTGSGDGGSAPGRRGFTHPIALHGKRLAAAVVVIIIFFLCFFICPARQFGEEEMWRQFGEFEFEFEVVESEIECAVVEKQLECYAGMSILFLWISVCLFACMLSSVDT